MFHSSRRTIALLIVRPPIHVSVLLAFALAVGCKSGVERDVVQREMRQQEDQIYALEDYLSEYQQLLCNARNENAQLKRQRVQGQYREGQSGGSSDESDTLPAPPSLTPTRQPAAAPGVERSVIPPDVPPLDMTDPEVPALDDQTSIEPEEFAYDIEPAAAEIEVVSQPPAAVVLRGEVQLDEEASGPRVLLEVEPVADDGVPTDFRGRLSLLVLDPSAPVKEQRLARWDFETADLEPMARQIGNRTTFEFPLQLPPDAPSNRPLELWVRLEPEDGEKLLGRTTLDVGRAGRFASAEVSPATTSQKKRHTVEAASAEMPVRSHSHSNSRLADSLVHSSEWQTAKPGDRPKSQAARAASEWKLATRPVPEAESTPMVNSRPVLSSSPAPTNDDRYEIAAAPDWSPERPASSDAPSSPEPDWSPTR